MATLLLLTAPVHAASHGLAHGFSCQSAAQGTYGGQSQGTGGMPMNSGFLMSLLTGQEFTGLNLFDFIALGLVIFFLARFLGARRGDGDQPPLDENSEAYKHARNMWNRYQGGQQPPESQAQGKVVDLQGRDVPAPAGPDYVREPGPVLPADFDADEFMQGAKLVFARMQDSLAQGDLEDMSQFASGNALDDLTARMEAQGQAGPVDITRLNARLLEVKDSDGRREAAVYFDGVLSRRGGGRSAVREVWRFRKDPRQKEAMWLLEEVEPLQ